MARITIGPTCWKEIDLLPNAALGTSILGGYIICRSGGTAWIVAPAATEVSRTWDCRNDAVTTAQANASCGDWFVPTCGQLKNPGHTCRTYWDSYSCAVYWSSTELNSSFAYLVNIDSGGGGNTFKCYTCCVRAFRCVTY